MGYMLYSFVRFVKTFISLILSGPLLPMILQVNSVKRVTKTPFMMNIKKIKISKIFIL